MNHLQYLLKPNFTKKKLGGKGICDVNSVTKSTIRVMALQLKSYKNLSKKFPMLVMLRL